MLFVMVRDAESREYLGHHFLERDDINASLQTGAPVVLRVPTAEREVVRGQTRPVYRNDRVVLSGVDTEERSHPATAYIATVLARGVMEEPSGL